MQKAASPRRGAAEKKRVLSEDKEEGEIPSASGGKNKSGAKRARKNRGGKNKSPKKLNATNNQKEVAENQPNNGTLTTSTSSSSAPTQPGALSSLLTFLPSLAVSSTADPLLIVNPNAPKEPSTDVVAKEPEQKAEPKQPKKQPEKEFIPRLTCKFYLKGRCGKGADCTFSHAVEIPQKLEVCKFFKSGVCRKGEECAFSHSFKDEICLYFMRGECTAGARCKYSHDSEALAQGKVAAAPVKPPAITAVLPQEEKDKAAPTKPMGASMRTLNNAIETRPLLIALSESSSSEAEEGVS